MNVNQFREKLSSINEDNIEELEILCLKQLIESSKDFGTQGADARDLLKIVARKLEIYL